MEKEKASIEGKGRYTFICRDVLLSLSLSLFSLSSCLANEKMRMSTEFLFLSCMFRVYTNPWRIVKSKLMVVLSEYINDKRDVFGLIESTHNETILEDSKERDREREMEVHTLAEVQLLVDWLTT